MQRFAIIVTVVLALGGPSLERGRTAGGAPASIRQLTQQSDAVVVARTRRWLCDADERLVMAGHRADVQRVGQARTSHCRELDAIKAERGWSGGRSGSRPRYRAFLPQGQLGGGLGTCAGGARLDWQPPGSILPGSAEKVIGAPLRRATNLPRKRSFCCWMLVRRARCGPTHRRCHGPMSCAWRERGWRFDRPLIAWLAA